MSTASKVAAFLSAAPTNVVSLDDHRERLEQQALDLGDKPVVRPPPKSTRRGPVVNPDTSEAFERAWTAYAAIDGLRRSTRRLAWPQWVMVARVLGEEALERAVVAFVRDPQVRQSSARVGACGFQVWLRQGRYEHWGNDAPLAARTVPAAWRVPEKVRAAVVGRWGADWAASWLRACTYDEGRSQLIATTGLAADKLFRECRAELIGAGVRSIIAVRDGQQIGPARMFPAEQIHEQTSMVAFPDLVVRDAFHARFSDERVRDWFDQCGWNEDLRVVRTAPGPRRPWLVGPFDDWAKANRVRWS